MVWWMRWQRDRDMGAFTQFTLDGQVATVGLHDQAA
jgi:hypothetical protein